MTATNAVSNTNNWKHRLEYMKATTLHCYPLTTRWGKRKLSSFLSCQQICQTVAHSMVIMLARRQLNEFAPKHQWTVTLPDWSSYITLWKWFFILQIFKGSDKLTHATEQSGHVQPCSRQRWRRLTRSITQQLADWSVSSWLTVTVSHDIISTSVMMHCFITAVHMTSIAIISHLPCFITPNWLLKITLLWFGAD